MWISASVIVITIVVLWFLGVIDELSWSLALRSIAVWISLSASLGRGGVHGRTFGSESIPERIDREMFRISRLGTASILILAFSL